jgi:pimeloyl-ACP methyl ester carboxylesterase
MIPTVLVPGLLCSAEIFAPQIPALWPYGPVTVASTLEGETIAEIAAAVLASAPPRFALAGLSMGGYVSFEIMRRAPERVLKLALLDTSARPDTPTQTAQRRSLIERARDGDFEALTTPLLTEVTHPSRRHDAPLRAINLRMMRTIGFAGFARQTEAIIARVDSRPGLATISAPTLVLVGDSDPLTPPELSEEIAAAIPNARLAVAPQCGHASTLERPEFVNRMLGEWIAG